MRSFAVCSSVATILGSVIALLVARDSSAQSIVPTPPDPAISAPVVAAAVNNVSLADLNFQISSKRLVNPDLMMFAGRSTSELQQKAIEVARAKAVEARMGPAPFSGLAWQQEIIVGLAGFLADRAQAEVMNSVIEQAGLSICKKEQRWITPSACTILSNASDQPAAWGTLRVALARDLSVLPDTVIGRYISALSVPGHLNLLPGLAVQMVRHLEHGEDPVWILTGLRSAVSCDNPDLTKCAGDLSSLLAIVSRAVELVHPHEDISRDNEALRMAAEDIHAYASRYYVFDPARRDWILSEQASALRDINRAIFRMRALQKRVKKDSATAEEYRVYVSEFWSIVSAAPRLVPTALADPTRVAFFKMDRASTAAGQALGSIRRQDYASAFVEVQVLLLDWIKPEQLPAFFRSYGPFFVQLASATDAKTVEETLKAAAVPLGSYKAKRGARAHSFGLNSYVGGQYGRERLAVDKKTPGSQTGLFAPLGLEGSLGFTKGADMSVGVMLSIIDVGSLLSVRTDDDDKLRSDTTRKIESAPEIGMKQLLAPGLFVSVGISRRFPLLVGGGVSLHPAIRSVVSATNGADRKTTAVRRLSAFIAADVPLFRF